MLILHASDNSYSPDSCHEAFGKEMRYGYNIVCIVLVCVLVKGIIAIHQTHDMRRLEKSGGMAIIFYAYIMHMALSCFGMRSG